VNDRQRMASVSDAPSTDIRASRRDAVGAAAEIVSGACVQKLFTTMRADRFVRRRLAVMQPSTVAVKALWPVATHQLTLSPALPV
jgi:hypothetical protein